MPSAVDFLPPNINVFVNFVTSLSLNFGSGMMRRLGTSRRRGMGFSASSFGWGVSGRAAALPLTSSFRALYAVLGALAVAVDLVRRGRANGARRVERSTDDV